jgi:N-acetylneuraminic acid mutarotase
LGEKADIPVVGTGGAQAVIGGLLYVYVPSPGLGEFFRYDPATDTWIRRAAPPIDHHYGVAGVIDGKFYLVGGEGGADRFPTAILNVYNPVTNSWTTKVPMSTRRRDFFGGVISGKLYVTGGVTDTGDELKTTEVYDPATNAWTTKASMPSEQVGGASAVAGGKLFVIGGFSTLAVRAFAP